MAFSFQPWCWKTSLKYAYFVSFHNFPSNSESFWFICSDFFQAQEHCLLLNHWFLLPPLILLSYLGIRLIQRLNIGFLAYLRIIFFLITFIFLCFFSLPSPQSYCIYLVNHLHHQPIFSPIVDVCFLVPPTWILILLLFLASWRSSCLCQLLFYLSLQFWFSFHHSKLTLWAFLIF